MKKLLTLMLALSVLFMTSCGNAGISETTATQEENIEYTDYSPTGEVLSFGDNYLSGFQGHIHFEKEIDDETEIYVKTDLVPVESVTVLGKTYQLKYVETYSYYGGEMQRDQYDILNGEREGSILKVQDGKVVFFTDIAARIDMSLERTEEELVDAVEEANAKMTACLRCGRCNDACSLGLVPQMMAAAAERKDYDRLENKLYGMECVACGSCT